MSATPPSDHGQRVASMFGRIARWYDVLNHGLSGGQDILWRKRLVSLARPKPGGLVLDLAAGTLDVSLEILAREPQARVLAMDFARPMLEQGRRKITAAQADRISCVLADGRFLPLPDACLDAATIAFGIRNILPRADAFAEIHRCLKPGGRLCVLEFGTGKSRIWKGFYNFYLNRLLPLIGRVVSGDAAAYRYLADTIRAFPTARELAGEMAGAGFDRTFWLPLLSGIVYIHVAEKAADAAAKPADEASAGDGTALPVKAELHVPARYAATPPAVHEPARVPMRTDTPVVPLAAVEAVAPLPDAASEAAGDMEPAAEAIPLPAEPETVATPEMVVAPEPGAAEETQEPEPGLLADAAGAVAETAAAIAADEPETPPFAAEAAEPEAAEPAIHDASEPVVVEPVAEPVVEEPEAPAVAAVASPAAVAEELPEPAPAAPEMSEPASPVAGAEPETVAPVTAEAAPEAAAPVAPAEPAEPAPQKDDAPVVPAEPVAPVQPPVTPQAVDAKQPAAGKKGKASGKKGGKAARKAAKPGSAPQVDAGEAGKHGAKPKKPQRGGRSRRK